MTAPTYESTTVTDFSSDTTAHLVNMPATVNAGDLLLAVAGFDMTATITTPPGWTLLADMGQTFSSVMGVYAKVAVGDEDGTTVDFVTSAVQRGSVHVIRVSGWAGHIDGIRTSFGVIFSSGTLGMGICLGSTARDVLFVAASVKSSATAWNAGPPTGYSNNTKSGVSEDTTASSSIATATRTATVTTEWAIGYWNVTTLGILIVILPIGGIKSSRASNVIGI